VLNFIPARLTALLMVLVTGSSRGIRFIYQYGSLHKSPNAGYPEAALAGILNVRFGGPNVYKGVLVEKPFIGEQERPVRSEDLAKAARINHVVCLLTIIIILWLNIF
jgi:adenosylcobinamide-phosphate synthase